jgi:hypothetical protein
MGGYMPSFRKKKLWDKFEAEAAPDNNDFIRNLTPWHFTPYFWDNEVYMDLHVHTLKGGLKKSEVLNYTWELCGLDDTVIKTGKNIIEVKPNPIPTGVAWGRKSHAIPLGYLSPKKHYRVFVIFTKDSEEPIRGLLASFTIQDKDEIKMQFLVLLVGIVIAAALAKVFSY